ncbi:hypothetical protein Tsubulata_030533 [Turnera subulata]|uniref:F-box domain-containing protein n=1 Tax=Turnera subulata TaxID=218843 RepID=A0A9Q0G0R1_9ROSI|nr:hypothetical protein Tsubulata_030533 [Turnera subulata]
MKATHSVVTLKQEDLAKGVTMAAGLILPSGIVEEILALLPDKTIHRLRLVSKSWSSLLVSVNFHKFRLKSTPPEINVPKFLYRDPTEDSEGFVISDYRDGVKTPTKVCSPPHELFPARSYPSLIGSCNGLVCLVLKTEIVIWNPFTGTYRKLPDITWGGRTYTHGFGYDSASDDYKVFIATGPNRDPKPGDGARVDIFSLKTVSWKQVENPDDTYVQYIQPRPHGLFLNEALHWKSWDSGSLADKKIFAFDLSKEKFYDVQKATPAGHRYGYNTLGVVGEYLCMCFFALPNVETNTVWVMKEYCNEASWVHFISYSSVGDDNAFNYVNYACDFVQPSVKDGGYMMLQYCEGGVDILKWNKNHEESETSEEYFKNIKFYRHYGTATSYTEALTSPYASTEMDLILNIDKKHRLVK